MGNEKTVVDQGNRRGSGSSLTETSPHDSVFCGLIYHNVKRPDLVLGVSKFGGQETHTYTHGIEHNLEIGKRNCHLTPLFVTRIQV